MITSMLALNTTKNIKKLFSGAQTHWATSTVVGCYPIIMMLARGRQEVTYLDHPYGSVLLLCGHPRTARSWTAICCAGLLIPSLQSEHGFTSECLAKTGTWHTCLQRANGRLSCFRWHLRHYETHWNLTWHGFTFTEISAFKNLLEEKKKWKQ